MVNFSYAQYLAFIEKYKKRIKTSEQAWSADDFILLRHDVEFSMARALQMAILESQVGVRSSFYFQVSSNFYNVLSPSNIEIMRDIGDLGHEIGLHLYLDGYSADIGSVKKQLEFQVRVLNSVLGAPLKSFSVHRPSGLVLASSDDISDEIINCYDSKLFDYTIHLQERKILYISDSNHRINYGNLFEDPQNFCKCQILIHPDEWSPKGSDEKSNFSEIISEFNSNLIENFAEEYKTFSSLNFSEV